MSRFEVAQSPPLPDNGEDFSASPLAVSGRTIRADDHFPDNLVTFSTGIIRVVLLAFARLLGAKELVGPGAVRVHLAAPLQDQVLTRSTGWHNALTQLTAIHGIEPME
jgi:hypothetical protein